MSQAGSSAGAPLREERDLLEEVVNLSRMMAEQQSQIREMIVPMTRYLAIFNPSQVAMANALFKGPGAVGVPMPQCPPLPALLN